MKSGKFLVCLVLWSFSVLSLADVQSKGINSLGFRVLSQIQKTEAGKNLFISPFSLHEALSMAYAGSRGDTQKELAEFLGVGDTSGEALNEAWSALLEDLTTADPKVVMEIANSMWANSDNDVKLLPEFVAANEKAHRALIREMNFQDTDFIPTLNGWVNEKTHGKIPTILAPPIPKDQLWYLVNAIYFKGTWLKEFDKKLTRNLAFTKADGKEVEVPMMTQGNRYAYSENESAQAVKIPFGKQDRFVMAMYLPQRNDSKAFFESLESSVQKLNSSFSNTPGTIVIPRFKVEYGNEEMVSVLGALGVAQSFSDAANFKGITYEDSKINKIIHKAVIEVNEEGAEAAAATVIGGARTTSVPVDLPFFFQADHPFYYEIRDEKTDVILFSGILNEPKQK